MYDTRLEMAASWLWMRRMANRKLGEPVVDPFCQQPEDVTEPVEREVSRIIEAIDTYDLVRNIVRVDAQALNKVALDLYKSIHPDWTQSISEDNLKYLEENIRISLAKAIVTGDVDYNR